LCSSGAIMKAALITCILKKISPKSDIPIRSYWISEKKIKISHSDVTEIRSKHRFFDWELCKNQLSKNQWNFYT
jgi:hypothetical protein